ncbi:trace amine-associated receptor 13c-like [Physella acuta]|uniref:trace amine-associated receptor 13c-like n=1 Tax=Physella acuta TaxID=109671 RepID=UPI0027DDB0E8|nr:trace amine-associated receptor 13c-like [Physella acuta]
MQASMSNSTSGEVTDPTQITSGEVTNQTQVTWVDCVIASFCLLISLFICTVNTLTIVTISSTPSLRTIANTYVVSLSVADLLVGLELIPTALYFMPPTRYSIFFRFIRICMMLNGLNLGIAGTSAFHITFISIDRYLYIAKPYFYQKHINIHVSITLITTGWVIGLGYSSLPQFFHNPYGATPTCSPTVNFPVWYLFYGALSAYITLVIIIFTMCYLIIRTAIKQRNAICATTFSHSNEGNAVISRTTMKSLKYFFTVFGVFFVCVTPTVLCMALDYYVRVPSVVYNCLVMLALSNSAMNFVILTLQNRQFRCSLLKTVRCLLCFDSWSDRVISITPTHN